MSNLPPGVTQQMIDAHFAGPCPDCADGNHESCEDSECSCDFCEDAAREDAAEVRAEAARERRMFGEDD
jgi:hypothetical protein